MGNTFSHLAACSGELSISPQPGFFELSQRLWALWATRSVVSRSRAERPARTWFKLESEAVDGTELNRSEVHRGVTVIIFMQADHFADQWPGDENQLALPFNLAVAADPAQCEVAGVDRICEPGRIGSRRRRVNRRRHHLAQGFVRALMVKLCTEIIEAALLGGEQYLQQAALAKEPLELTAAAFIVGRGRAAAQQVTAEGVGHGQRITGRAIAGAEPALEVDAPDIIGRHNRWHAGRRRGGPPPPFTPLAESLPLQHITDRALRRPVLCRRPCQQLGTQFLRPPARMLPPHGGDRLALCLADCPRHHVRGARALGQPHWPLRPKARQPLVAGLAAHPVFRAQRRQAVFFRHQRIHQPHPQFHGPASLPRHARTSCRDGLICYPCCRYILLPILPVRTVPELLSRLGRATLGGAQRSRAKESATCAAARSAANKVRAQAVETVFQQPAGGLKCLRNASNLKTS